jgi:hypothetical protein
MVLVSCTASIEAGQANVETGRIIDGVEALRAVFSVYRLICPRWDQVYKMSEMQTMYK